MSALRRLTPGRRRAPGLGLLAALGCLAAAPTAHAYVRYTSNGVAFAWPQSCVAITAYPTDFEAISMMSIDQIQAAANASAAAWSAGSNDCTYLSLSVSYSSDAAPRAINDHRNSLIFRVTSWCELQPDGTCSSDLKFYDPSALAVTSVVANKDTGQIRDADIEVNAADHHWTDITLHPELAAGYQDLQNALTHEMGHLIGLDHSCYQAGSGLVHPLDDTGNPAPDCDQAPPEIRETTMYPSATPGDIQKRDLAADDQRALCDIYPLAKDPMVCNPADTGGSGGCSCTIGRPQGAGISGLLIAALVGGFRRRARRRAVSAAGVSATRAGA